MASQGGPAPSAMVYIVVDPDDFQGRRSAPFLPSSDSSVPAYWSLRRTPEEALRRWSWWRPLAADRVAHSLVLSYRFNAHGMGCAVLGCPILTISGWGTGGFSGVRLRAITLERTFYVGDQPVLELDSVQNVVDVFADPQRYLDAPQ